MANIKNPSMVLGSNQFDPNGNYPNLTAGNATNATNDGQGRNIAETYALKSEVSGKKYAHYLSCIQPDVTTTYPQWGFYVGPIINDTSTEFTFATLQQWIWTTAGFVNPAISSSIRGIPASGRYDSYDVFSLTCTGSSLSIVYWRNNMMTRTMINEGEFTLYDNVVEI